MGYGAGVRRGQANLVSCSAVRGWSRLAGEAQPSFYGTSLLCHARVVWEMLKFEVALR